MSHPGTRNTPRLSMSNSNPPLAVPVADDGGITFVTTESDESCVPNCVLPRTWRGAVIGARLLWPGTVSPSQPILNRLGCVLPQYTDLEINGTLPYALIRYNQLPKAHTQLSTLISTHIIASKCLNAHCRYRKFC